MKESVLIYDSKNEYRNPPSNLKKGDEYLFEGVGSYYKTPASYIHHYRNVFVTGDGIILNFLLPVTSLIVCYEEDFKKYEYRYTAKSLLTSKKKVLSKNEEYFLVFDNYSGPSGFAHWIIDGLTRLVEVNDQLKNYTVILPSYFSNTPFYFQSLKLFDLKATVTIEQKELCFVKELHVASHIAPSGNFNTANIEKLRSFILSRMTTHFPLTKKNIYISRSRATRRYVINEDEVVALLVSKGFEILHMEDLSFEEQVSAVSQADCLVSIHGAALALEAFMKKGASVLEFRKRKDDHNNVFYALACAASLNYFYQECDFEHVSFSANSFNLKVDINLLTENLEIIFNRQNIPS